DRVVAGVPVEGRAAGSRLTLVARRGDVLEVGAPGALEEVAAGGGEVAQRAGGPGAQGAGEGRVARTDRTVRGEVAAAGGPPDAQATVGQLLDLGEGEVADIDEQVGRLDAEAHVVDEIGPAGEEAGLGCRRRQPDRAVDVPGAAVVEGPHDETSR